MHFPLLTLSSMWNLSVPEQFFTYADAYKKFSATSCQVMKDDPATFTWPHASVVLMLASHAVELFLKGALLKGKPGFDPGAYQHDLDALGATYRSHFRDSAFELELPFVSSLTMEEWIAGMRSLNPELTEGELREAREREKTPPPSILYRYPVDKSGKDWPGLYGFEPHSFSILLDRLGTDFDRIKSHLA